MLEIPHIHADFLCESSKGFIICTTIFNPTTTFLSSGEHTSHIPRQPDVNIIIFAGLLDCRNMSRPLLAIEYVTEPVLSTGLENRIILFHFHIIHLFNVFWLVIISVQVAILCGHRINRCFDLVVEAFAIVPVVVVQVTNAHGHTLKTHRATFTQFFQSVILICTQQFSGKPIDVPSSRATAINRIHHFNINIRAVILDR
nr:MAG TPA: hypothetical protein [Caudoviricetes sp.]